MGGSLGRPVMGLLSDLVVYFLRHSLLTESTLEGNGVIVPQNQRRTLRVSQHRTLSITFSSDTSYIEGGSALTLPHPEGAMAVE